ncbi:interferon alpha-inducible protein 27, mitochondrial-like isoform X1 [Castor canadensis]|uniref:Interferon alpha-inducible protein 27, mitochondrial-like isoform X2 n=3 Tax=Castor canadensis TaxID=51338 RepID=A0A250YMS6_CASCN|nr:interferon alpha-inducible protein 27, mitochondrial-like isoform X2 [Castor canadensis]
MELAGISMLSSSLASKIMAAATMAQAGGAASRAMLAGLSSQGLTLLSQTALGPAAATLGPLLGKLNVGALLPRCSASALAALPVGAKAATVALGGAMAVGAVPVVLGAMGFTGAGIAASSIAAKMMSAAAIANGGGVAAGSLVATLQSVGATGLSLSSKALVGSIGSALVARVVGL